ncbi:hypothetical protein BD408DRAFT_315067, partial [Parasitella parasitica]
MEWQNLPIPYHRLWLSLESLCLHQSMQAHLRTLAISRHQNFSLFGRLALSRRQQGIGASTIPNGSLPSPTTRLASQLQEVSADSNPTTRTPRLCIGYQEDD